MPSYAKNINNHIFIKGARVHNLKNIDVAIPRNRFVVITGLSGSGKSSLAFDTLYAEGQRRYVESLSSYARQFLGRMNKPDVEYIRGIPPAIAIEQKVNTRSPRSTVGTSTEIYDYLKLLYARIGKTYSPKSGRLVKRHTISDVVNYTLSLKKGTRVIILAPFHFDKKRPFSEQLELLSKQGITRLENTEGAIFHVDDLLAGKEAIKIKDCCNIIVDRIKTENDEDMKARCADSVQTAFGLGRGKCIVQSFNNGKTDQEIFSGSFEADGMMFEEPTVHMFSFNNPLGACPRCEGYGKIIGIDEDIVVPNKQLSVFGDAIVCWKGEKMRKWKDRLLYNADKFGFPVHKPYCRLTPAQKELLWKGNRYFRGLNAFFRYLEKKKYKIQYRVMLSRYRGKTVCPECKGTRLKKEVSYVTIKNKSITDLVLMPIDELYAFFIHLKPNKHDRDVAGRIFDEITFRLKYLLGVGLDYLTLNRLSSTLSGGEAQRINLATSLGSSLVGSLYILDEPSIGLHPRDNHLLINVLKGLKTLGNTVLVVEHDEEIIRSADQIIDIGPAAGRHGGEVVFQGSPDELNGHMEGLTAKYLSGRERIPVPEGRRKWNRFIRVQGAREHNLKSIDVTFPLDIMTVVTGVSGSGKSSLVSDVLYPALNKIYHGAGGHTGAHDLIEGDLDALSGVELVDQNPIGRSSRSNPATYLKVYDEIRRLFAAQPAAKAQKMKASHFSFNIPGGRCEECQGEGTIKVEMQFMADVNLICERCGGKRFKDEILDIRYRKKNVYQILGMTVNEAIEFFGSIRKNVENKIAEKLQPLADVGLGYVKLGQSSSTLSGGESQRVKLASFLARDTAQPVLFLFDEPTTGLHFHDIRKLLKSFNALIRRGNTVVVIEHNLEVIKSADWLIDLGPEGGKGGGNIVYEGAPEDIVKNSRSHTGKYLAARL